jgi:hypothetical protein
MRRVRRFRTVSADRVALHYAPQLSSKWHMPTLLRDCEVELDRLADRFGFHLRGRVAVFLFASHKDIGKIFGPRYGAIAFSFANAIVVADDNSVQESIRHELAHLFSARWGSLPPALLSEGLAVWLQETYRGQPIERAARPLLGNRHLTIPKLLNPKFFFDEQHIHSCYVLAGGFTSFLIRRYGWHKYCQLYRRCNGIRFRAKFERCFGVSLEKAEWQWRNEIMIMQVLNARLRQSIY